MKRVLLALVLACTALVAVPASALAHGKMHCNELIGRASEVGFGQFDPIVGRGIDPFGHEHMFFNNEDIFVERSLASHSNLVGVNENCNNNGDTASYWVPTVYKVTNGVETRLHAKMAIFYYRTWEGRTQDMTGTNNNAFPNDLRLVAGDPTATAPQPTNRVNWTCNQSSSRFGPWESAVEAACHTATGSVVRLGFHIDFPTCWSGVLNDRTITGNTSDFTGRDGDGVVDRLAYAQGTADNRFCPTGFTYKKLPYLRMTIQLVDTDGTDYNGDGRDIALSSGPWSIGPDGIQGNEDDYPIPGEPSQWTLHGDFLNAWVRGSPGDTDSTLWGMITRCINTTTAHAHGSTTVCGS